MIRRGSLDDMRAFAMVARARSFTRAAAGLGVSTSALSHTIKRLETQLDTRLLQRNTRSVAPTEAGGQLLQTLEHALADIDGVVDDLGRQRDRVAGTVRITTALDGYELVLRPALAAFAERHPRATVEVMLDTRFQDIIAGQFDAGIRLGELVEQDMIALRLSPELRRAAIASPAYLEKHGTPVSPEALVEHRCIGFRVRTDGPVLPWPFERNGRQFQVKIEPFLVFNEAQVAVNAAADCLGICHVLEHTAARQLREGTVVRILDDWTQSFPGYFLYYPSRRQTPPVLAALIEMLKDRLAA